MLSELHLPERKLREAFDALDTDGDGQLSFAEFMASYLEQAASLQVGHIFDILPQTLAPAHSLI